MRSMSLIPSRFLIIFLILRNLKNIVDFSIKNYVLQNAFVVFVIELYRWIHIILSEMDVRFSLIAVFSVIFVL